MHQVSWYIFDSYISLHRHISHNSSKCISTPTLRLVRNSTPLSTAISIASYVILPTLITAIIYYLTYQTTRLRLQLHQNIFSRCIFIMDRFSPMSIKSKLKDLHWLSIKYRIIFKNLMLLHNTYIHGKPDYLAELYIFFHPAPSDYVQQTPTSSCYRINISSTPQIFVLVALLE